MNKKCQFCIWNKDCNFINKKLEYYCDSFTTKRQLIRKIKQGRNYMRKMFFYGSLKRGYWNHLLISRGKDNKFVSNYTMEGFTLYDIGYPIAVRKLGSHINGEVWLVDDYSYQFIRGMELGARYNEEIVDGLIIYTQPTERIEHGFHGIPPHIGSDWPVKE